ncbi:MAG: hypothetical protein WB493_02575 [Anaeromyxobacteraceae bacterium]
MRNLAITLGALLLVAAGCDPTVPCTVEEAQALKCRMPEDATGSTGPTGPTGPADGVGFEAYGRIPNGGHISLDCTPWSVPAFADHDCLYSHLEEPETVSCTMKLADRHGMVIGVETAVSFMSEAGAISPVAFSPAYPGSPETLGHAVGYLEVYGAPLPPDVSPFPGELSATTDFGCGPRTANPRDGYVTVIAWVRGEEGFVDANRNGVYDLGEPFVDEGEPYVDGNDNGRWDPGEWFLDVNGDGAYTGPNGRWDADTFVWSQTRVVYTGLPRLYMSATGGSVPPLAEPAPAPFSVHAGPPPTISFYDLFFTDILLNPLDLQATYRVESTLGNVTARFWPGVPAEPFRQPPEQFRLLYCDATAFPASCHDGPMEAGCRSSPCYLVPDVGLCGTAACAGFPYGNYAALGVEGRTVGPDTVWVSASIAGKETAFGFQGQCVP